MMRTLLASILLILTPMASAETLSFDSGDSRVTLLELYTSEGCSSCPPAEQWVSGYLQDSTLWQEIVPVVFHVDYWDYLGWKDRFASNANTRRQYQHQREGQLSAVYTPGIVADGREFRGFFAGHELMTQSADSGRLTAKLDRRGILNVQYSESGEYELNIAVLGFDIDSRIRAGENHGRTLKHNFTVLEHQLAILDEHQALYALDLDQLRVKLEEDFRPSRYALALWLTRSGSIRPVQATGGWISAP